METHRRSYTDRDKPRLPCPPTDPHAGGPYPMAWMSRKVLRNLRHVMENAFKNPGFNGRGISSWSDRGCSPSRNRALFTVFSRILRPSSFAHPTRVPHCRVHGSYTRKNSDQTVAIHFLRIQVYNRARTVTVNEERKKAANPSGSRDCAKDGAESGRECS